MSLEYKCRRKIILPRLTKDSDSLAATGKWKSATDLVSSQSQDSARQPQQRCRLRCNMHEAALAAMTVPHLPIYAHGYA